MSDVTLGVDVSGGMARLASVAPKGTKITAVAAARL